MIITNKKKLFNKLPLLGLLLCASTLIKCDNSKPPSSEDGENLKITTETSKAVDSNNNEQLTDNLSHSDSTQSDTTAILPTPSWMGPLLLVHYDEAAILIKNYSKGDTLPLEENAAWTNEYFQSDSLISIGRNGIQEQKFIRAIVKNPGGDCNSQVVLKLQKQEPKGFLARKDFANTDSIQFFEHQKEGKLYYVNNQKEPSFYDAIFPKSNDAIHYDSHSFFITGNNDFVIEKRGTATVEYNEGLEEEHHYYLNDFYRVAYKKNKDWIVSAWTPCLQNTNAPSPLMICFEKDNAFIVWGFSEGMGDYQMYVSRIGFSGDTLGFENGKKMQGLISLGCD